MWRENELAAPTLKALWKAVVVAKWSMHHCGTGRATCPWRRPVAVQGDGGTMRGKDVYRRGGEALESERTAFEDEGEVEGRGR